MRVFALGWLLWAGALSHGLAQAEPAAGGVNASEYDAPTVVLVMESPGGLRAASALREALNEAGCKVVSLVEAQRRALKPIALLTVGADKSRIEAVYWKNDGRLDVLSAVSPATQDQIDAVVLALSSALIERHRSKAQAQPARWLDDDRADFQALYAHSDRAAFAPRTNVYLRFDEF